MRTYVSIKAGRWRNRVGWIAGELDKQNPAVTKVLVHVGDDSETLPITDLAVYLQTDLFEKQPERKTPPARGRRRFVGLSPW